MSEFSYLSEPAEANLRAAFDGERHVRHDKLLDRMHKRFGYRNRNYVGNIIIDAWRHGMVSRTRVEGGYEYSLVVGWERPSMRKRARPANGANTREYVRKDLEPAVPYQGPAFDRVALAAHVGRVCGESQGEREDELPPCVGERIVGALHRQFDEVFLGVE